ncbi:MAG: hypothetical protein COV45_08400 [Deltaproteobacteria bacterium CG11_big_fil_rev_8_21_14_0_20_47_16]|nr:MAG: hypothetical protein COV45_08400 [Deltaproteobacteria bacterium CG11_big_fil_rev_8_21_14_0_20_47_16]
MKKFIVVAALLLAACGSSSSSSSSSTGTTYTALNYTDAAAGSSTLITGVRAVDNASTTDTTANVYISGFYAPTSGNKVGLLYTGPVSGTGTWQTLNFPSSTGATVSGTELYGPNNGSTSGTVQIVGNYTTTENGSGALGLLYQGATDGSGTWSTLNPQSLEPHRSILNTIAHSTMGGFVVGNYDTDLITGKAFIYDIANDTYYAITKPGAVSITAYGIWYNGGTSYTIAGGFSNTNSGGISTAYVVDWDSSTHTTSNWTTYTYNNLASAITHFEGITTDNNGGYNLVADWVIGNTLGAAFVNIPRTSNGAFGTATWTSYAYPGATITSANTIFLNNALGIFQTGTGISYGYVATFN